MIMIKSRRAHKIVPVLKKWEGGGGQTFWIHDFSILYAAAFNRYLLIFLYTALASEYRSCSQYILMAPLIMEGITRRLQNHTNNCYCIIITITINFCVHAIFAKNRRAT